MPKRPDSAIGLRVIACMIVPETANAEPVKVAPKSLGNRIASKTLALWPFCFPNKIELRS